MKNVIAVDFGSSNVKISVYSSEYKVIDRSRFFINPLENDGDFYWDILSIFDKSKEIIEKYINDYSIKSIGICSWGVDCGYINLDKSINAFVKCYRSISNINNYNFIHENIIDEFGLYLLTGSIPAHINSLYSLYNNKNTTKNSMRFVLIADLFAYYLTGNIYCEKSNASTTGFFDFNLLTWNKSICQKFNINQSILPPLISSGENYGKFKNINVLAVPSHDTASTIYSMKMKSNSMFISSGSWLLTGCITNKPTISQKAYDYRFTNEYLYKDKYSLISNDIGLFLIQKVIEETKINYEQIDTKINSYNTSETFDVDCIDLSRPIYNQICNLVKSNSKDPVYICKCVYDSLILKIKENKIRLETLSKLKIKTAYISGGLLKVPYFCNNFFIENCVIIKVDNEGASLGNAMFQLLHSK